MQSADPFFGKPFKGRINEVVAPVQPEVVGMIDRNQFSAALAPQVETQSTEAPIETRENTGGLSPEDIQRAETCIEKGVYFSELAKQTGIHIGSSLIEYAQHAGDEATQNEIAEQVTADISVLSNIDPGTRMYVAPRIKADVESPLVGMTYAAITKTASHAHDVISESTRVAIGLVKSGQGVDEESIRSVVNPVASHNTALVKDYVTGLATSIAQGSKT